MTGVKNIVTIVLSLTLMLSLISCGDSGHKSLMRLCTNLRSDYICNLSFTSGSGESKTEGSAELSHAETLSTLKIKSPELLSGMQIEYDTVGAPSAISVHFSGIDLSLPEGALARINRVAALSADDFVSVLEKIGADKIAQYDTPNGETAYFVEVPYKEATVTVFFSKDGEVPYSIEYLSEDASAVVEFTDFELIYGDGTE